MASPGVVYAKDWVVDFVLDVAGYTSGIDLLSGCVVEPSCGDGAFLRSIAQRLCDQAQRDGLLRVDELEHCVRAYDLDADSVSMSRAAIKEVLERHGLRPYDAQLLSNTWVRQSDFLLAKPPRATWVVGNPPYVRATMIPRNKREEYRATLSCATMGSDLYVGFFEKGLSILADDGSLCYICSDRWLQNRYGSRLRAFNAHDYSLDVHIRMHGVDAFEDDVAAYPAVSLIRRGAGRPVRYVDCSVKFSAGNAPATVSWARGDDGDRLR